MDHLLVAAVEKALGWSGPAALGTDVAAGQLDEVGLCARLLTPTRLLDTVMRRSLGPPQLRFFDDGLECHPDRYLTRSVTRRGQALAMADMDRLSHLLGSGTTMVLDAVDTFDPTMELTCRAWQWWSREAVQVNTYLSTGESDGFALHWDDHDVLVVQLAGTKRWQVRDSSRPWPMYRDAQPNSQPTETILWTGELGPGGVLHVPRGYWHQASRAGLGAGYSLHVTFGFVQRTGVDWLSWLADRAREREPLRRDLKRFPSWEHAPGLESAGGLSDARLRAEAERLLAVYPVGTYLAEREQQRPPPRYVATGGLFGPPAAVLCVAPFPPRVSVAGEVIEVCSVGKKLSFARRAAAALEMMLSGRPAPLSAVGVASGLSDAAVAGLAETLIREGVCAELTEALSSGCTGLLPAVTNCAPS